MNETPEAWYELRNAIYAGEFDTASKMLIEQPALIHLTNGIGETALHYLAVENDLEGVSWLQARGADLNTKNEFGIPVIFEVASLEYKELFDWFLAKGADIRAQDANGQDIILYLLEFDHEDMAEWVRGRGA
jgi:ankyrin repeat protein